MEHAQQESLKWGVAAGAATALLYLLSVSGGFFSLLIAYTPLVPLLAAGLSQGVRAVGIAALIAIFVAGLAAGLSGMLVFGLLYGTPAIIFTHIVLTHISEERWYPVGGALTGLSIYSAIIVGFFMVVIMGNDVSLTESLNALDSEQSPLLEQAHMLLEKAPFIVFALGAWIQILMFYAIAVFANYMLKGWDLQRRSYLRLTPFMPSTLVLGAMLVAGLISFSPSLAVSMAGKTAFLVLLLPYFLVGIARMHARAKEWPNARLWLSVIYALTVLVFWPVFWFIGAGIVEQAKFLSNRHGGGTEQ